MNMTLHHLWFIALILGAMLTAYTANAAEKLHPRTLCPKNGSTGQTILLIDTTDPFTQKAQERLKELLTGFQDAKNTHYIEPGHELIVYRLRSRLDDMEKALHVCNPGNPKERTWKDNLISGRYGDEQKWRQFFQRIQNALPGIDDQVTLGQSPLLESIALIIARHVPSIGLQEDRKPTRLILFSDMLQHSDYLSHYKSLPEMGEFKALTGYTEMQSDLKKVKVWLFYVRRAGLEHLQKPKHYYWWPETIKFFGGELIEYNPL